MSPLTQENYHILKNLSQAYEAEFSALTGKIPDPSGCFEDHGFPVSPYIGYLLYYKDAPAGFCISEIENEIKDIAEFYVIPSMRHMKLGYKLAALIFHKYPGKWQVRQIQGAEYATHFWRSVIKDLTHNNFKESKINDPNWGLVTCQTFIVE